MIAGRDDTEERAARALLDAGARFVFVHGSRAGTPGSPAPQPREDSDVDLAAWWGVDAPDPWTPALPPGVDLLVLDSAPLWLAGRVATHGRLLATADAAAEAERVRWQVDVLLRWSDERPGLLQRYEVRRRQLAERAGG
ncbi:hypothetical protein [Aquipuribacter sp. SD81]|uniref:hypothetical protein n=1 Tax=Aquipuribacter sp. SD81 TaxID=3127703 RepID=UPI003017DCEA